MSVPAFVPASRAEGRDGNLLDQAFTRAAGTPLVAGNRVRLLKNAAENYPAWLAAIRSAERTIHFENYFITDDAIGREFALALGEKARDGVRVRLIYDWMGGLGKASRKFWRGLRDAGVDVRCFNPPQLTNPFGWLNRDHRKVLAVDSRIGFVTGLCVGKAWLGDEARGLEAWRDTGVQVEGPALRDIEQAFAQVWSTIGTPLPVDEQEVAAGCDRFAAEQPTLGTVALVQPAGEVRSQQPADFRQTLENISMRIVANAPGKAALLRLDQIIAAAARRTLWLTDAYFAGIPIYVQTLRAAALDGVDVRLLVPGASDIPLLRPLSQAGYRPLLEAGIRVFEWKGTMLHAKTAVADRRWARVGSSNLNMASWIGNFELDAVVENESFAAAMEAMYEEDLQNSTEIVLNRRRRGTGLRVGPPSGHSERRTPRGSMSHATGRGSASRAAAGALRLGRTVGAALTDQRVLGPAEAQILSVASGLLLIVAILAVLWPIVLAVPVAIVCAWSALALLTKARALRRERTARNN